MPKINPINSRLVSSRALSAEALAKADCRGISVGRPSAILSSIALAEADGVLHWSDFHLIFPMADLYNGVIR